MRDASTAKDTELWWWLRPWRRRLGRGDARWSRLDAIGRLSGVADDQYTLANGRQYKRRRARSQRAAAIRRGRRVALLLLASVQGLRLPMMMMPALAGVWRGGCC